MANTTDAAAEPRLGPQLRTCMPFNIRDILGVGLAVRVIVACDNLSKTRWAVPLIISWARR